MDIPTTAVFESVSMDFINQHMPSTGIVVASTVKVASQALGSSSGGRNLLLRSGARSLQSGTILNIEMDVEGRIFKHPDGVFEFDRTIDKAFSENMDDFKARLSKSSNFFKVQFDNAERSSRVAVVSATQREESLDSDRGTTRGPVFFMIMGAAAVATVAFGSIGFLTLRYRRDGDTSVRNATSWNTNNSMSPTSSSSNSKRIESSTCLVVEDRQDRPSSPTDSEIYNSSDGDGEDSSLGNSTATGSLCKGQRLSPIAEDMVNRLDECSLQSSNNSSVYELQGAEIELGPDIEQEIALAVPVAASSPIAYSSPSKTPKQSQMEDCFLRSPTKEDAFIQANHTPKGTKFVQLNTRSAQHTGSILDDLDNMEEEWSGQLDSKVTSAAQTPKQNNLQKFKKAPKESIYKSMISCVSPRPPRSPSLNVRSPSKGSQKRRPGIEWNNMSEV